MKLGELRVAIRAVKGNPMMQVTLPGSAQPIKLGIMKMILLDQLELAFPVSKMQETGLAFDAETMMLSFEGAVAKPDPHPGPTHDERVEAFESAYGNPSPTKPAPTMVEDLDDLF